MQRCWVNIIILDILQAVMALTAWEANTYGLGPLNIEYSESIDMWLNCSTTQDSVLFRYIHIPPKLW